MKIELVSISIENFKGIKKFDLKPNGGDVWVRGENGTGKTTVADAFFWLFSNSNSDQRSNFNIIPLDNNGNVVNFIKPTVEAVIKAGNVIRLKKVYRQVWSKPRGSEEQVLTGHTTDYFFDEVPVTKTDYENRLNEVIKSDLFRSLADVKYFCGSTTPQYRRNIILDVIGEITDDDIISKFSELAELPQILNGRSIDDYRKVLNQNRRAINRKLDEIPASIKERRHGRPDIEKLDHAGLKTQMMEIDQKIDEARQNIAELGTGVDIAKRRRDLIQAETDLEQLESQIKIKYGDKRQELASRKNDVLFEIRQKRNERHDTVKTITGIGYEMEINAKKRDQLMKDWEEEDAKQFTAKTVCFACGQKIPEDQVATQKKEFVKAQDKVLADIEASGQKLLEQYNSMQKKQKTETEHSEFLDTQIEQLEKEVESITAKIVTIDHHTESEINEQSNKLRFKVKSISEDIDRMDGDIEPRRKSIVDAIQLMEDTRKVVKSEMDKITKAHEIDERVKELEADLAANGKALERNAYEAKLMDEFLRRKAEYIEETVSGHFTITEWKLFEALIGGNGYKDICEPLYDGIPYNTDLNTGARINIGLDVIATLSRHYGISCPIFVDNAESITDWIPTENQVIRLFAEPELKELNVKNEK